VTPAGRTDGREASTAGKLARLGFTDGRRAERLLADPALAGLVDPLDDVFDDGLLRALGQTPDPDLALVGLVRLLEATADQARRDDDEPADGPLHAGELRAVLRADTLVRRRLLAVLGASAALGDHLARHPAHWQALREDDAARARPPREALLRAVGADPADPVPVAAEAPDGRDGPDALRVAYRRRLLAIAGADLGDDDPALAVDDVSRRLADLAAAALEAALAVARARTPAHESVRLAVVAMGKCGGRELNYVSDVDVIHVAEPADADADEESARAALDVGARLASGLARVCSAATAEGTLWPVDAALRPEGKNGPLVRTVASHVAYYERWAKTWEFQALLKARPVAGDAALGREWAEAVYPMVWSAAQRENFVEDVRAMRRRVEAHLAPGQAGREIKLGPGGLRDVEFSLQLLQMVHGRADRALRTGNTLLALEELAGRGYVGRDDAARLDRAYRFLRVLEHRLQLHRLRRTHMLPTAEDDLRRLARASRVDDVEGLRTRWGQTSRDVRRLHERLFYAPLLEAAARLSTDEARLSPEAARARLAALGYRDPAGAMRHLAALTEGVSRRAAIQRQLLPVLLGWFADGADPDAGLLAFRRVSESLGSTHWYLKMLRDSGAAAERMAAVLSGSRFVAELLEREPESTRWLGDDAALAPRPRRALVSEVEERVGRAPDLAAGVAAARALRRREMLRVAIADVAGLAGPDAVGDALTDAAVATLTGALAAVCRDVAGQHGGALPTRVAVVGMGRLGGGELGYGSDADVLFVHDPVEGADEQQAQEAALAVVGELQRRLRATGSEPSLEVDAGLRPEGRNGPLVRSLASYAEYYRRWSLVWEAQALLRAVPVAGDSGLGKAFVRLVDPVRYAEDGLSTADVREVRRVKARVEAERLPRGTDPRRHLKLGPGGLADVEWTAQLLQLRHAGRLPELRTPSTVAALEAAAGAGLVDDADVAVLVEAWRAASRLRDAAALWRGRPTDVLPSDLRDLEGVARLAGYPPASVATMEEDHLRRTRRARAVVERVFYS
jgi:[glutamine synthetase] adenylyltransferase / [glutamine synthetase]-adenylyl-L-tyrosine phosphorylase